MLVVARLLWLVASMGAPGEGPGGPSILWDAPPTCPGVEVLERDVNEALGPEFDGAEVGLIIARARPTAGDRWELLVTFADSGAQRRLVVDDCDEAARAAAFVVAITIDSESIADDASSPAATPVSEPTEPVPTVPAPTPTTHARADDEIAAAPARARPPKPAARRPTIRTRGLVQAGAAVHVGILPRTTAGVLAAAGLDWPRARLALGYVRWFPGRARLSGRPDVGGDVSVHALTASAGPVFRWGSLELPLRAGLEVGAVRAAGFGTDHDRSARSAWAVATIGTGLHWAPKTLRGRGALVLQLDGAAALVRPRLVVDDTLQIFQLGRFALRGALLLEARFP